MIGKVQRTLGALAALLLLLSSLSLQAQAPILEEPNYKPTLTFDIATIRQAPPPTGANFHVTVSSPPHSSRFEATNLPIKALLQIAYGFDAPVINVPDWATNTFYNIQARSDDADARLSKLPYNEVRLEKRNAIRVLLTERLGLQMHLETRNSAIYNLTVAKGGTKMQLVPPPPPPAEGEPAPPPPLADTQAHGSQHGLEFIGTNSTMRSVTGSLSAMLEAPVVDKTGLNGTYNYTLRFGRDWSANDPDSYPSIFTAVQEQLGLKLEAVHESVPNLVIDHLTKPTEN